MVMYLKKGVIELDYLSILPHVQQKEAQKIQQRFTRIFEKNTEPNETTKNRFLLFAYLVNVYEHNENNVDSILPLTLGPLVINPNDAISPKVYFNIHKLEIKNEYIKDLYETFCNVFYDVTEPKQKRIDASVYMMYIKEVSSIYEIEGYEVFEDDVHNLFYVYDETHYPCFPEELLELRKQLLS